MTQERKSESIVTINAKFSSFNFEKLNWRDRTTVVEEGRFVTHDTSGFARLADENDLVAYVNFLVSSAPSVTDFQSDPFDPSSPEQGLLAGGLSGIQGAGIELAIPLERWYVPASPANDPAVGKHVIIAPGGAPAADHGKPVAEAAAAIGGDISFGVITKIRGETIFFMYNSIGTQY
jgi:hypothetical protein